MTPFLPDIPHCGSIEFGVIASCIPLMDNCDFFVSWQLVYDVGFMKKSPSEFAENKRTLHPSQQADLPFDIKAER